MDTMKIIQKISKYFLLILIFTTLFVKATDGEEAIPEFQGASVRLYTNENDGKLWVHIKLASNYYKNLHALLPNGDIAYIVHDEIFINPLLRDFYSKLDFNFPASDLTGGVGSIYVEDGIEIFNRVGVYIFKFNFKHDIGTSLTGEWADEVRVEYLSPEREACKAIFKTFEDTILNKIPPSMILSMENVSAMGYMTLAIEGAKDFTFSYDACTLQIINMSIDNIVPEKLYNILDFIQPFVLSTASGMDDVWADMKPHIAGNISTFRVRNPASSDVTVETTHNLDGTISLEISASGELK